MIQRKCCIFKNVWRIFKNFFSAERSERWQLWLKMSIAQIFWLCNSNVTTFRTSRKCKNFNFSLYTIRQKCYISKVFNEFQKLFLSLNDEEGGYCGWKFQVHRYFGFAIATLPLFQHPENVIISIFPFTMSIRNAVSSKVFHEFSKTFFWLEDEEGGYSVWIFQVHRYFAYAIASLPLFQRPENVKISIFPFTLSQQKCYISKVFKTRKVAILVENLKCADILALQ